MSAVLDFAHFVHSRVIHPEMTAVRRLFTKHNCRSRFPNRGCGEWKDLWNAEVVVAPSVENITARRRIQPHGDEKCWLMEKPLRCWIV